MASPKATDHGSKGVPQGVPQGDHGFQAPALAADLLEMLKNWVTDCHGIAGIAKRLGTTRSCMMT